uniref:Uncharacterized protein n=1 Tax=Anguilla anguilla TaxID=7936 RepID=A0A0E9R6J1_ANGAN
MASPRSDSQK